MFASRKILALPIFSLQEGQRIGHVRSLVINPNSKSVAALVVDPKGFFQDQRIIPFNRVSSIGEDAITVASGNQAEKAASLPNIMGLIKERTMVIGLRVVTDSGKTLGLVEEFYVDPETGNIMELEVSGGRIEGFFSGRFRLKIENIMTFGKDAVVIRHENLEKLVAYKGLNENARELWNATSDKASDLKNRLASRIPIKKKKESTGTSDPLKPDPPAKGD
ncbi:MAG: PRC-barrel domain-containing protein [Peptococcaceae bacterium]|nr:PRC-barrel domain-containing protein [Peptococcaceae bacterium]